MRFNIFDKKYHYLGLHINEHALKALEFSFSRTKTTIRGYTNVPMSKGLIVNDTFTSPEGLEKLIISSLHKPQYGSFSTDRVIISIPEDKSFIRVITMPLMTEAQADNAILFEAEAYIPLPMDQVYFDWQIIRKTGTNMDVLMIASPKAYVDSYMGIIEKAGLKLCGIEVEAQSVARALLGSPSPEPLLIADMDAFKTSFVMVENGVLKFTSSVPIAGNIFTERLSKALSITSMQAEQIKREYGLTNTTQYPNLRTQLMPAVEDLAAEIKNILKFHYDHSEAHIGNLIMTGGGSKLQHIAEIVEPFLEQYAPIKINVADPLQHVPRLINSPLSPYEALSFTTAIGLAMWEVE